MRYNLLGHEGYKVDITKTSVSHFFMLHLKGSAYLICGQIVE